MDQAHTLLRDIAATMETVVGRILQIPEDAGLDEKTWDALDRLLSGERYLRRYR